MTKEVIQTTGRIDKKTATKVAGTEAKLLALVDSQNGRRPGSAALIIEGVALTWKWSGNSTRYGLYGTEAAIELARKGIALGQKGLLATASPSTSAHTVTTANVATTDSAAETVPV